VDEKPSMQALSRTTGYVQTKSGKTVASFDSVQKLFEAIEKYITAHNETAEPFVWKKREVHGSQFKDTIENFCS